METEAMNFIPHGNRFLVQRCPPPKTKGGLLLPETKGEKPKEGIILKVGNEYVGDLQVGDKVYFSKFAGTDMDTLGSDDLLLLKADEVLGFIPAESTETYNCSCC